MYPKKQSRTKPKSMLERSLRFVLKRGANFHWATPCANYRKFKDARCSRETTSRTKPLMWHCSPNWAALRPTWKLAKLWMHMGQCQGDGKQAYTQALMQGILAWIRLPRNRWPKEWIGVFKDPVVLLSLDLYGHPDSGGLWQRHCEKALFAAGFHPLYPECWPSMFWHPRVRLLLGVYVDVFKMSGPSENIDAGWKLIASQIDMDTPEDAGLYLGFEFEHIFNYNVKLDKFQIIHVPMFSMRVFLTLLLSQPVRPAERGTTGSTCQSLEFMFITTCNLARSSRTSRRTLNPSGRERTGLPSVNLANQMMNPKNLFTNWNLKTQLDFHCGGRDQPTSWTSP